MNDVYIKKPIMVHAFKLNNKDQWPLWLKNKIGISVFLRDGFVFIKNSDGEVKVEQGDYIIKGIQDELYSCKPDIFQKTYTPAFI